MPVSSMWPIRPFVMIQGRVNGKGIDTGTGSCVIGINTLKLCKLDDQAEIISVIWEPTKY